MENRVSHSIPFAATLCAGLLNAVLAQREQGPFDRLYFWFIRFSLFYCLVHKFLSVVSYAFVHLLITSFHQGLLVQIFTLDLQPSAGQS